MPKQLTLQNSTSHVILIHDTYFNNLQTEEDPEESYPGQKMAHLTVLEVILFCST